MKTIILKVAKFSKKSIVKIIIIPMLIGAILGLLVIKPIGKVFFVKVHQNFHFEGSPNWLQFLTDSTIINDSFMSIPNSNMGGLTAYANGNFSTVMMLQKTELLYDSINFFQDCQRKQEYTKEIHNKGKLVIEESDLNYITPVFFGFHESQGYYYRETKIKDYSKKDIEKVGVKTNEDRCNATMEIKVSGMELITIKSVSSDLSYCLSKQIPPEFFVDNPLMYSQKLINKFLPIDSCKTLLVSILSNSDTKIKLGSKNLKSIVNGGKVKVNNITYEGDYMVRGELTNNCNDISLSKNPDRPFDIAISIDKDTTNTSYFGLQSSLKYVFLTSPKGLFTIGNKHYSINQVDKLELDGNLQMNLIYDGSLIPKISIEGTITSCKLNTIELLKTKWEYISSDIRAGIIGGTMGFLLSLIALLFRREKR